MNRWLARAASENQKTR